MAEPTPALTADPPGGPVVYRPLSGLSIGGLGCAALYAALVVFALVMVFLRREPFLLPSWLLLLPTAGAVLSLLALRQIRNAEGTRAGSALAHWGLWLSVLSGLGSATYTAFTGLAIKQQADDFLRKEGPDSGFFPRLEAGDINSAFLLTQTPTRRRGSKPKDQAAMEEVYDAPQDAKDPKGLLTLFRASDLVHVLRKTPAGAPTIESLGVRSWGYESKGYKVERTYRIRTAEAVFETQLTVQSLDGVAPGEGRKWVVLGRAGEQLSVVELLPLGETMMKFRFLGHQYANRFLAKLALRDLVGAYLDTRPPGARAGLEKLRQTGTGLAALPGFEDFTHGKGILYTEGLRGGPDRLIQRIRQVLPEQLLASKEPLERAPNLPQEAARRAFWEKGDGKLRITYDLECPVKIAPGAGQAPMALLLGKLAVEADDVADPARAQWRVARIELERILPLPLPSKPPGP